MIGIGKITCAKINEEIVKYDACSKERYNQYNPKLFRYIGKGVIWSVNGILQRYPENDTRYFWVRR